MTTRTFKLLLSIIFAATIASISACRDNASIYQNKSLNLVEPVEITSWATFADGGSIEITLKDAQGKTLAFYYDLNAENIPKDRHIYIGKKDHENARQVPAGSPVEREILKYVSKWMEINYPDFRKDPNRVFMHDGKLIASESIVGLIEDLKKKNP